MTEKAKELGSELATGFGYSNFLFSHQEDGLTKREYFAAMAMGGLISSSENITAETAAKWAIKCSDAILEELSKTE